MNLIDLDIQEINTCEIKNLNGGVIPLLAGAIIILGLTPNGEAKKIAWGVLIGTMILEGGGLLPLTPLVFAGSLLVNARY